MPSKYRARPGDTVDLIAFNNYGRTTGTTEAILAANPGLSEVDVFVTPGVIVVLPDVPEKKSTKRVTLWSK